MFGSRAFAACRTDYQNVVFEVNVIDFWQDEL
jgi:hypothetical protein